MAADPTSADKPPFDKLIDRVPSDVRERGLGLQGEGQAVVLTFIQLPSVLSRALHCGIDKLGECIGLSQQQVSDVISAADGDKEGQIRYLLTTWAELRGEKATVEALMKGLYDADDTRTIDEVVEWMNTPDFQRAIPSSKKLNFLGHTEGTSGSPYIQSMQKPVEISEKHESQSELPAELSRQQPIEESSHIKEATTPVPQSCEEGDPHSKEIQKPVEESVPSTDPGGLPPVVPSVRKSHLPATLMGLQTNTTTEGEEQNGTLSTDTWRRKMEEDICNLKKDVEEMKLEHRKKEESLKSRVMSLEEERLKLLQELSNTNEKLQEALEKSIRESKEHQKVKQQLKKDLEDLGVDNQRLKKDYETLKVEIQQLKEDVEATRLKAAVSEKKREELQKENQQLKEENKAIRLKAAASDKKATVALESEKKLKERIHQLEDKNEQQKKELLEKTSRIERLEQMLQKQNELMTDLIEGSAGNEDSGKETPSSRRFSEAVAAEREGSSESRAPNKIVLS